VVGAKGFEPLNSSASKKSGQAADQYFRTLSPVFDVKQMSSRPISFGRLLD